MTELRLYPAATEELIADGYPCPTIQKAVMWMLKKHGIDITWANTFNPNSWESCIRKLTDKGFVDTGLRGEDGTYEGAMNDAIYTALAYMRTPKLKPTRWQRLAAKLGYTKWIDDINLINATAELLRADFPPLNFERH